MLGYTGSISAEKLEELNKENKESIYSVDDQIGISGLESTYEDYLRREQREAVSYGRW